MHFLPENRMCAPPFATKQRPPHLENPGSATAKLLMNLRNYLSNGNHEWSNYRYDITGYVELNGGVVVEKS